MAGKWPYKRVEKIALKIAMGPFGSSIKVETFTDSGIPIISGQHLREAQVTDGEFNFIKEAHADSLKNANVQRGDVIFTHAGNIGQVSFIPDDSAYQRYVISQRQFYLRCNTDLMLPEFITYYFKTPEGQHRLLANANQVGVPSIARPSSYLKTIEVPAPSIEEQQVVVRNIKALDAKIRLNIGINQTLEAMAQAIFKSWFVDFDPVKAKITAKQEGRDPLRAAMCAISGKTDSELDALPPEHYQQLATTAALFPDEMVDSELGEIPRGWVTTPIRDVAELVKGKSYSSKDLVDNDQVALVTLKSFERGGGFRMDGFKPYVGPYKPEQVVLPGDLIVAYTDVTQAAELIGKPAVVVGVDHFKTLVASLDVGIVRPMNERVSRQFLYGLFMTDAFQSHTFAHTSGTTVLHLAKEGVPSYIFPCPDERLVGHFSKAAESMAMEKQKLLDQNRSLATLRDTLLPKLLSGELSVADVTSEVNA